MEEAEALGSKIAIQVDGQFRCFGSAQHIKKKFGAGFTVTMKLDLAAIESTRAIGGATQPTQEEYLSSLE